MAGYALDAEAIPDERTGTAEQELLAAERHAALREALLELPPGGQRLILLLIEDPPVPYAEISVKLGIPVGSIGPTRSRCLDKLRDHPAVAALIDTGSSPAGECNTAAAASGEVSGRFSAPAGGAAGPTVHKFRPMQRRGSTSLKIWRISLQNMNRTQ